MMIKEPQNYPYELLQLTITNLPKTEQQIAALAYGTGSRASELNQIKKSDITFDDKYMRITCKVLKKRKGIESRVALIRLDEEWLVNPIKELILDKQDDEILLPFHRATIWKKLVSSLILKGDKVNPHGLRKIRATHLATRFGFDGQKLKHFFNWSRSDMADNYVKLNVDDLRY
jgi:integrase/recombinase XerD